MSEVVSKPNERESDELFDAIVDEVLEQHRAGLNPQLADFEHRYPEHAAELREIFSTLLFAERMDGDFSRDTRSSAQLEPDCNEYPRRIGEFELLHELGRGGMGVVFAAHQTSLNRLVAVKLLSRHLAADPRFAERFAREARSAARLQHPNIVSVFSNGVEQGFSYYSMQLIEGKNLAEVLIGVKHLLNEGDIQPANGDSSGCKPGLQDGDFPRRLLSAADTKLANSPVKRVTPTNPTPTNPIPTTAIPTTAIPTVVSPINEELHKPVSERDVAKTAEKPDSTKLGNSRLSDAANRTKREAYYKNIAALARDVAWALEYAHQQGTVHRDIKPSNLILDKSGKVWIADFGLAKLDSEQRMTQAGDILGTLRYVAPEQLDGVTAPSCDIYGVGVTLYELATLQPAWIGDNHAQIMQRVRSDSVIRPRSIEPSTPRDLETIILTAMARNPDDRYRSARELGDDLDRFCHDQPIRARKPSSFESLLRWSRRNRLAAASIASALFLAAVVVPVIAIAYSLMLQAEASRARLAEQSTIIANTNSKRQLVESLIQQSRAVRESRSISARQDCINTLQTAKRVLAEFGSAEAAGNVEYETQLRDEAVAALALPSFREAFQIPLKEANRKLSSLIHATDSLLVFRENRDNKPVTSIYDVKDLNQPIRQFDLHADFAQINRQKTHLISHSNFHDGLMDLAVWRISDGKKIWSARFPPYQGRYSPGEDHVIALESTGRPVIVDLASGDVERGSVVCNPTQPHPGLCCSPSTETLALVYYDRIEVRNFDDGRLIRRIRRPKTNVNFETACWSPRDNWFAVKSTEGCISLFDPRSWESYRSIVADPTSGTWLSATADGRYLESKTWSKRIEIFDVISNERVANVSPDHDSQFINISSYLVGPVSGDDGTRMLELVPSRVHRRNGFSPDTATRLRDLAISPNGKLAVVQVRDSGGLGFLDLEYDRQTTIPLQVSGFAFDAKGDFWGMSDGKLLRCELISSDGVVRYGEPTQVAQTDGSSFAIDPSGTLIAWNKGGGVASCNVEHLADIQHRKLAGDVRKLAISPDKKWIAGAGHNENGCWLFDAHSHHEWVLAPNSRLTVPRFSTDGKWMALTVTGESLQLFRCGDWDKPLMTWGPAMGQPAFSQDGLLLAASFDTESISLIRLDNLEVVHRLTHPNELTLLSLSFTSDGTRLLFTGEESNCVHEWNLGAIKAELELIGIPSKSLPQAQTTQLSHSKPQDNQEEWLEFASEFQLLLRLSEADQTRNKKQIRKCIEELYRVAPNNPKYCNWLAWDLVHDPKATLDEKTTALGLARKTLELDGTNANYLNTYGVVFLRLGYLDEAVSTLEDARNQRRNEDSSVDSYFLAIAFAKKGLYFEAAKHWSFGMRSQIWHRSPDPDSWPALYESTETLLQSLSVYCLVPSRK
jgi:eukaryotic-like serine/threonine-protein kinase